MAGMKHLMTTTGALVFVLACSAPAPQSASAQTSTDVAGRLGDRSITVEEVDKHWLQTNPGTLAQARQALFDGRKQALDSMIAALLIEQAAKAKGMTVQQFTEAEMARRVKPVTDADISAFYDGNKERMQGRPLDRMGPAIRQFLEEQGTTEARAALIAELRGAAPPIRTLLEPPRQQVTLTPDDLAEGDANAPVTVVEFSDFQCPFCAQAAPTLARIRSTYGKQVRFVWKDLPLTAIHPQAFKASEAGWCANEQGKFWNYHDHLFANRGALEPANLKKYAAEMKLDTAKFDACLDSSKYSERVRQSMNMASTLGVTSTPSTFVNGRLVSGAQPYAEFAAVIDDELERARQSKPR